MMGPRQEAQPALFHEVSLEDYVPPDHLCAPSTGSSIFLVSAPTLPISTVIRAARPLIPNS